LLPSFVSVILPIAMLIGVLFTYNRMMVDSELVVMRASGLSHRRLALPAILLAACATIFGYGLTLYLVPASYHQFKEMQAQIRNTYSSVLLQEGVFNSLMPNVTVYVRERRGNGELLGIIVHDGRSDDRAVTMMAERGAMSEGANGPRVLMLNGNRQELMRATGNMTLLYFDRYIFDVGAFGAATEERWREPRERFIDELFPPEEEAATLFNYNKLVMEGHSRLSSPLLILAATLIALTCLLTGEFNRRGQLQRVMLASGLVIGMQALWLTIKSAGEKYLEVAPLLYVDAAIPIVVAALFLAVGNHLRRPRRAAPAPV
jgi:lipopolysaccharide export system permease protein